MATEYHPSMAGRVRDLCYLGATNAEIAHLLGVGLTTLEKWREEYPEFDYAWKDGKSYADAKVAKSLFKRACGYTTTKWKETKDGTFTEEVHVAPDVGACIFWLTNRQPDHWQQKIEHTGQNGGPIQIEQMSEVEIARRVAFALAKAANIIESEPVKEIENGSSSTREAEQP
jgi:hypothetical protein